MEVTADEVLNPSKGFVWAARMKMGLVPVTAADHYLSGDGAVDVTALGIFPAAHEAGPDVTRSSRHRAAAESVWVPSSLLSGAWEAIDTHHARVTTTLDGEAIPMTLTLGEDGRLREVQMMRHGKEGVDTWQLIPYGFLVDEERTFGGYTIPSVIWGGWWYGTEEYDPDTASGFEVLEAEFR